MTGQRVLIVDDALIMRKRIKEIAEEAGWQVAAEARDGEEAVALYQQQQPDLVTLDIVMPNKSGVRLYREMKESPEFKDIPVLFISGIGEFKSFMQKIRPLPKHVNIAKNVNVVRHIDGELPFIAQGVNQTGRLQGETGSITKR